MKIKIAVAQIKIHQFHPAKNLKKAESYIKKAALSKAQIIIFPEDFVTGPIFFRHEFADPENKYCRHFQNLAKKYGIDIIPGSFAEQEKSRYYNTTYYIDCKGKIKSRYRKINLWHTEKDYLDPGHEVKVFNTRFGKVGIMICWDMIFPEMFRKMIKKGANIIFCPSYWGYEDAGIGLLYNKNSDIELINSVCVGRAFENEIIFVFCNAAGKLDTWTGKGRMKDILLGYSQITVPFKGCVKRLEHHKEAMFIQEVDTSILKDAEKVYKIRKDLKKKIKY